MWSSLIQVVDENHFFVWEKILSPFNEQIHYKSTWRQVLMCCLCVSGSSTKRATQRRSVSSTRPWSTATPSSPLSPSSELWDASRSTLLMQPEQWVKENKAGISAILGIVQFVFLHKYISQCYKGNTYLVIYHLSLLGNFLLTLQQVK